MFRTLRIGLLLALVAAVASPQEAPGGTRSLEKTLADLDEELRRVEQLLKELTRSVKIGDPGSAAKTEAAINLLTAQEAYQRGRIAEERREYDSALESFNTAIQLDPRNDSALLHRGHAYLELGNLDMALMDLNQSLGVQPNNSRAYELRASVYRRFKSYGQALGDLQAAIGLDPNNVSLVLTQAAIAEERGDLQGAIELYAHAQAMNMASNEIRVKRAAALRKGGRLEESLTECTAIIDLEPSTATGYICRAESYVHLSRIPLALADLDQAMRVNPMALEAGPVISAVWRAIQLRTAAQQFNTITQPMTPAPPVNIPAAAAPPPMLPPAAPVAANPVAPAAVIPAPVVSIPTAPVAAPTHVAVERPAEVPRRAADADRALSSTQAQFYTGKGRNWIAQERYQEAVSELNKAIELDTTFAQAYNSRGYAYLRMHDYLRAIADFTSAIRLNTKYANAYHNRGSARKLVGDLDGSRDDFQIAEALTAQLQSSPRASKAK